MSRGKKKPAPAPVEPEVVTPDELNVLMSTYRESVLPTPVLLWRTEGKTVAAYELTEDEFAEVQEVLGHETQDA